MKPSIPKGTRDFSPQEMVKRNYIFDTIRSVFRNYGYLPIETPSMENLDTLMGKYGEEGDKLIFKILNSGNPFSELNHGDIQVIEDLAFKDLTSKHEALEIQSMDEEQLIKRVKDSTKAAVNKLTEKALRYDLTVPFARYVVQHQNDITFPFKRYQVQPVWRADRPQKGRYREFYQCDADVIGSTSLLNEVELIQMIDEVFTKLGVPVIIKINNRKILQAIAEFINAPDRMIDIAIAIDKLDKIGMDGVHKELIDKKFSSNQIADLIQIFSGLNSWGNDEKTRAQDTVALLKLMDVNSYKKGNEELKCIFNTIEQISEDLFSKMQLDFSLARGLNYYTGTIIEVKVDNSCCTSQFTSSICGGGRYDDLTGIFGLPNVSGVGISFGADRIYDVMEELNKFPEDVTSSTKVMFVNFGNAEAQYCLPLVAQLRKAGISAELYPDAAKMKKQMGYADNKKVAYVAIVGSNEMQNGVVKLKNMTTGEEKEIPATELAAHIQ